VGQKFSVIFSEPIGNVNWTFKVRMDASYGYAVYLDGVLLASMYQDVWRQKTNPRNYTCKNVAAGQHVFEVYGGQARTHGGESGKWMFARGSPIVFVPLTLGNLNAVCKTSPRIAYYSTFLSSNQGVDNNKNTIEAAFQASTITTGYCIRTDLDSLQYHSNTKLCKTSPSNQNIGQRFQISFEESGGNALWHFKIFIDSGYGYSVYLDGAKQGQYTQDVWTSGTNPFTFIFPNVGLGPHKLVVYGGEGCCDGEAGTWMGQRNRQGFVSLTVANIDALSARTDPSPFIDSTSLQIGIQYFSTFLKRNRGSVDANKEVIESRFATDMHAGPTYCSSVLTDLSVHSNYALCGNAGSRTNIGQKFSINFIEPLGGASWTFVINIDAGYGYSVYFDGGTKVGAKEMNVYSGGTNPGVWTVASVTAGAHVLTVYGAEGCCDLEAGAWTFTRAVGGVSTSYPLTVQNLKLIGQVPRISYYSTLLPANLGTNADNKFWIENKFQNQDSFTATGAYCLWTGDRFASHANHDICQGGSSSNIGQRFEIVFMEPNATATWDFVVYMDAGYGYSVYVDGVFFQERVGDVWAGGTNPAIYSVTVGTGLHSFVVYGGEGCCDGKAGDWKFQRNSGGYWALSAANLVKAVNVISKNCTVPTISYYSVNLPSNQGVTTNKATIQTKIDSKTLTTGYCNVALPSLHLHSNQRLCVSGTNSNIGQKFTVTFSESVGGATWSFRINIDSGYGYIVYLDGVLLGQMTVDVWSGDTNPKTYSSAGVSAGQHVLEVYGGEGCCDGEAGNWAFARGSDAFQPITIGNLNGACQYSNRITYYSTLLTDRGSNDLNKNAIETAYLANTQNSGYCSVNLIDMTQHANHDLCPGGSNSNIGQRFQFDFQESGGNAMWKFRIFMDSGFGYSVYFDGVKVGQYVGDVWAGTSNPFTHLLRDVSVGFHRFVVYGGEGCCDGEAGTWQVQRNNQGFVDLTSANLDSLSRMTDRNAPVNPNAHRVNIRYFSTFLPNQGTTEANREFIETRAVPNDFHGGTGYCTKNLTDTVTRHSNQVLCPSGSNQNIGQRFVIRFIEPRGGVTWSFKVFIDAGMGYNVYLDYGIKIGSMDMDVWSGTTNPTIWTTPQLGLGVHKLVVYGGEGCCDGEAGTWQFSRNGAAYQDLRVQALTTIADSAQLSYFSTYLPNQGTPVDNQFYIENMYQNNLNNGNGFCSWSGASFTSHTNQNLCAGGSNSNIGSRFDIYFAENEAGGVTWDFKVFMDAGFGYCVYLDGVYVDQRTGDVFAGATYTMSVPQGFHHFVVYGGEGCCDGKVGDWQFQRKGTGFKALTAANLDAAS